MRKHEGMDKEAGSCDVLQWNKDLTAAAVPEKVSLPIRQAERIVQQANLSSDGNKKCQ